MMVTKDDLENKDKDTLIEGLIDEIRSSVYQGVNAPELKKELMTQLKILGVMVESLKCSVELFFDDVEKFDNNETAEEDERVDLRLHASSEYLNSLCEMTETSHKRFCTLMNKLNQAFHTNNFKKGE